MMPYFYLWIILMNKRILDSYYALLQVKINIINKKKIADDIVFFYNQFISDKVNYVTGQRDKSTRIF